MYGIADNDPANWGPSDGLTAAEVAALNGSLAERLPCANPMCRQQCDYRATTSGRQKAFCGATCRIHYQRERQRLLALAMKIEWTRTLDEPACQPAQLARLLSRVQWLLRAYGGPDPDHATTVARMTAPPLSSLRLLQRDQTEVKLDASEYQQLARFYAGRRSRIPTWLRSDEGFQAAEYALSKHSA